MTIKQVQTNFNFDVDNQLLSCPYDIYTVNSSYPFLAEYKDGKPCWTYQRNSGQTSFKIIFTTSITQLEFDYYIDNIDGFCVLFGINMDESTVYHLVNVSKSYPSYGNYVWWNPDRSQISDGILDANTWFHFVIEGNKIQIYNMSGKLLYSRSKVDNVIQSIELQAQSNYQPYIANMTVTLPEPNEFLDKEGLIKVWEQIGKKYYSKEEINTKLSNLPAPNLSNYYTKEEVNELISNITPSAEDNNEIITANNILFSLPTPTSLVEDEEGTIYTLTDKTILGE